MSPSTYINFYVEINTENLNQMLVILARISKPKNIFGESQKPSWTKELFVKDTLPGIYGIEDLNAEKMFRIIFEVKLQKSNRIFLGLKKRLNKKITNFMLNGKVMIVIYASDIL